MSGCVNMNKKAGKDEHVDRMVRKVHNEGMGINVGVLS